MELRQELQKLDYFCMGVDLQSQYQNRQRAAQPRGWASLQISLSAIPQTQVVAEPDREGIAYSPGGLG